MKKPVKNLEGLLVIYFLLFHTIHDVLKAEKILKKHGLRFELVPVPRNLSSDCGMCIRLQDSFDQASPLLGSVEVASSYLFDGSEYRMIGQELDT